MIKCKEAAEFQGGPRGPSGIVPFGQERATRAGSSQIGFYSRIQASRNVTFFAPDVQPVGREVRVGTTDREATLDRKLRRNIELASNDVGNPAAASAPCGVPRPSVADCVMGTGPPGGGRARKVSMSAILILVPTSRSR